MQDHRAVLEEDAAVDDRLAVHRDAYVVVRNVEEMMRLMTSSPLFIIVAESTVILGPIRHVG